MIISWIVVCGWCMECALNHEPQFGGNLFMYLFGMKPAIAKKISSTCLSFPSMGGEGVDNLWKIQMG